MRIAYVSHVSSRWIKQRPHFLVEALGRLPGVQMAFFDSLFVHRRRLVPGQRLDVPVFHLPLVPQRLRRRLSVADKLLGVVSALLLLAISRPDVVILTHARHSVLLGVLRAARVRVIYDCMDLNREFDDASLEDIEAEYLLVEAAEVVWCSSSAIAKNVLVTSPESSTLVVRNALDHRGATRAAADADHVDHRVVRYVGTVSSWFRFEDVMAVLESQPDVRVELIGPADVVVPEHPRLLALGPRPHGEALRLMASSDVLIMPFEVTPLILGVDPVKVYEYISTGRPVVCCDYPELSHFGEDIVRASGAKAFADAVSSLMGTATRSGSELRTFIERNSWDARARLIAGTL